MHIPTKSTGDLSISGEGKFLVRLIESDDMRPEGFSRVAWFYNQSFIHIYTDSAGTFAKNNYMNDDRLEKLAELVEVPVYIEQDPRLGLYCLSETMESWFVAGGGSKYLKKAIKDFFYDETDECFRMVHLQLERVRETRLVEDFESNAKGDRLGMSAMFGIATQNLFEFIDALQAILSALKDRDFKLVGATTASLHNRFKVFHPEVFSRKLLEHSKVKA